MFFNIDIGKDLHESTISMDVLLWLRFDYLRWVISKGFISRIMVTVLLKYFKFPASV